MKRVKNRWRSWIIILVGLPVFGTAQNVTTGSDNLKSTKHEFSVLQAVDYAKNNNVQVKNAMLNVLVQEQTNRELTAAALPQISGSGSYTYNAKLPVSLVPAEFFGGQPGTFEKVAFGLRHNATLGVQLNQLLFDGQVFVGLQARETVLKFQEKNLEVTEELIKTNIYKIYYQLVASKRQTELLDANIERFEKLLRETRIIYENGFAEKLDVDRVNVALTNLQTEKIKTLNQIENGYLGLKLLMGMPVQEELVLTDTLDYNQVRDGILEAGIFAYTDRKEYQYAELGVSLNEYNLRRYKLSKYPTLSLNSYYNKNAQRTEFDFLGHGDWFDIAAITVNLNIPIFTGFAANSRIQKARIELQQGINERENLKISIDHDIQVAKNNFRSAISTLDFQKRNMDLAENVFQQTEKKYAAGTGSQTEINTAQTDLKTAQTNYITALYEAVIAKVDFLKATGKL
ncbi:MAG TPA: TolC family protein [Chitinophagaceae bacterium]|nr:TolC family protein [Chitinophagaceae bacterium]